MIEYQICKEFPALDPWRVDEQTFHNVIMLFASTMKVTKNVRKLTDPNRKIMKKAGDDWF